MWQRAWRGCGRKVLITLLAFWTGLLATASSSSSSGFEAPSAPWPKLESAHSRELRYLADQHLQPLHHHERDYHEPRAFERLRPEMREQLLGRERAWDPPWGVAEAVQQVDLSKISPVVQIAAFQDKVALGPGSGTIIHPSGVILTNSHVVRKGPGGCGTKVEGSLGTLFVILVTEEGKEGEPPVPKFTAVLVPGAEDPQLDIALLRIDQQVEGLKDLKELKEAVAQSELRTLPLPTGLTLPHWNLWDSRVLKEESRVLAWGYPADIPEEQLPRLELSRGPIFTLRPPEGPQHLFIDKLFTIGGISGGPVVDPKTDLIVGVVCGRGIPTKPAKPAEELTKAVLINEIQELLEKSPQRINRYPVADFTWSPLNPKVGDVVTFDASPSFDFDGSIKEYEWDFNSDGKPDAAGKQVSFKVPSPEDLRVTLTIKDNEGASNFQAKRVILQREKTCLARIGEREFTSIQEAIEKAKPGDTITISEGQCQEDVLIARKQNLTLKGAGRDKTTLFGTGTAPVIAIQDSQGITIEGLTIRDGLVGLLVQNSSGVTIRQNAVMQNLGRGINLMDASGVKIEQNVIEANVEEGLQVRGAPRGEPVEVRANEIRGNEEGGMLIRENVRPEHTLQVRLVDNKIEKNELVGVAITHFSAAEISGGHIIDTNTKRVKGQFGIGLEIDSSRYEAVTVAAIMVSNNEVAGIEAKGASREVTIISTMISGNRGTGLVVEGSATVSLTNSQISGNGHGLWVWGEVTVGLTNSRVSRNVVSLSVHGSAQVNLTNSQVFENVVSLDVWDSAMVHFQNSKVFNNWDYGLLVRGSAQVSLTDSQIANNRDDGLDLGGSAQVSLTNSQVADNWGYGLSVWDSAQVSLINSQGVSNELGGLKMRKSAQARLSNSQVSGNGGDGLDLWDLATANIRGTWISDNAGCGILGPGSWGREGVIQGEDNWVHYNARDQGCGFEPPVGFLRETPPRLLLEAVEVCPGSCSFSEVAPAVWALKPRGTLQIRAGVYQGGIVLVKDLHIEGTGPDQTIIRGPRDGFLIGGEAQVRLERLQVSGNGWDGLNVRGLATVEVGYTIIEGNGTWERCQQDLICNGLEVGNEAQVTLSNSIITNNADWGVAATLQQCGYSENYFIGQVTFQGTNIIDGNNKSGNQNGMGNPGNHPWNRPEVPDGQVCLP